MQTPLTAVTEGRFLVITSDQRYADCKFEISYDAWDPTIRFAACIDGREKVVNLSVSIIARELGIAPEDVAELHEAGRLFVCDDGMDGEERDLGPEVESFLRDHKEYLESLVAKAAREGRTVHLSKSKDLVPGTNVRVPASMNITPGGFRYVHNKSYDQGVEGACKMYKTAVMINPEGQRRLVARMVANPAKRMKKSWQKAFDSAWLRAVGEAWKRAENSMVGEARVASELQNSQPQERLYGMVEGENKRGEKILTLYLENFSGGDMWEAEGTIEERITRMGGVIASLRGLHACGYASNDIKRENMFYNRSTGRAVLADYGFASRGNNNKPVNPYVGTPLHWSPERIKAIRGERPWTHEDELRDDIWAMGCSLYEYLINENYCFKKEVVELGYGADRSFMDACLPGVSTPRKGNLLDALVKDMLHFDPLKRPTIEEVYRRWRIIEESSQQSGSTSVASVSPMIVPNTLKDNSVVLSSPSDFSC